MPITSIPRWAANEPAEDTAAGSFPATVVRRWLSIDFVDLRRIDGSVVRLACRSAIIPPAEEGATGTVEVTGDRVMSWRSAAA